MAGRRGHHVGTQSEPRRPRPPTDPETLAPTAPATRSPEGRSTGQAGPAGTASAVTTTPRSPAASRYQAFSGVLAPGPEHRGHDGAGSCTRSRCRPRGCRGRTTARCNAFIDALSDARDPRHGRRRTPRRRRPSAGRIIVPFPHTGDTMTVPVQNRDGATRSARSATRTSGSPAASRSSTSTWRTAPEHPRGGREHDCQAARGDDAEGSPRRSGRTRHPSTRSSCRWSAGSIGAPPCIPNAGFRVVPAAEPRGVRELRSGRCWGCDVDVSQWLPPDTMSHNFDNIADVQDVLADAAPELPRRGRRDQPAGGRRSAGAVRSSTTYTVDHDGVPDGARGGRAVRHAGRGRRDARLPGRRHLPCSS